MSILIQGMEMPQGNSTINVLIYADGTVYTGHVNDSQYSAVSVPTPHGRLGDLDALIKDLAVYRGGHNEGYGFDGGMYEAYNNSIELVQDAPTVIEAEGETE